MFKYILKPLGLNISYQCYIAAFCEDTHEEDLSGKPERFH